MKRDRITGRAAKARPDINKMAVHPVNIDKDIQHSTTGVRRRVRRGNARTT